MPSKKSRTVGVWVPAGKGKWVDPKHVSWRDPADAGVLVHDAFHHSPRDMGGNEREWESLGVEMWQKGLDENDLLFEHQLQNVAANVLGAIIELPEDGSDSRFQSELVKPANTVLPVPDLWKDCLGKAIREEFEFNGYEPDDTEKYVVHAAGWAWRGYLSAQKTFPDPYRTKDHVTKLAKIVHTCDTLASQGILKKWTARWDDARGIRASWESQSGTWSGISLD